MEKIKEKNNKNSIKITITDVRVSNILKRFNKYEKNKLINIALSDFIKGNRFLITASILKNIGIDIVKEWLEESGIKINISEIERYEKRKEDDWINQKENKKEIMNEDRQIDKQNKENIKKEIKRDNIEEDEEDISINSIVEEL